MTTVESAGFRPGLPGRWWRAGAVLGLAWAVIFLAGELVIGDSPSRGDAISEIRGYFTGEGDAYLIGDYAIRVAMVALFIPFLVVLRRVIGAAGGWAEPLATVALAAGLLAVVWGSTASFFWGALAVGAGEFDESTVRALMDADAYAFAGVLVPVGVFMGAAGLAIRVGGVLWRWLGVVGAIGFVASLAGSAWPIGNADPEKALALVGDACLAGMALFVVLVSVNLLMLKQASPSGARLGPEGPVRSSSSW